MEGKRVAVIGGGLAGAAAALFARRAGASVTIVAAGGGATSMSSGSLDVAGDPCPPIGSPGKRCTDVDLNIEKVILTHPGHPYSIIARAAGNKNAVMSVIDEALPVLFPRDGLLKLAGGLFHNQPCFTQFGTVKFTALFPQGAAQPSSDGLESPLILDVDGLSQFNAAAWAKVAQDSASKLGNRVEPRLGKVRFKGTGERPSTAFMMQISRDPDSFVEAVSEAAAQAQGVRSIILPPVLPSGIRSNIAWFIGERINMPVYELLAMPPSAPGQRLATHLSDRLAREGVRTISGKVTRFESRDGFARSVEVGGRESVEAESWVLASGKYIGGGLEKTRAFRETIFGLPLFLNDRIVSQKFSGNVTGLKVTDRHALFEVGVKVDELLRPVDRSGKRAYENLFAAGAVLSGYNYMVDGTGAGVAIATGAKAGMNAAE